MTFTSNIEHKLRDHAQKTHVPEWSSGAVKRGMRRLGPACGLCDGRGRKPVLAPAQQIADAVWMSMLLSAFAGVLAVTVVVATFYFIRWTMCEGPHAQTPAASSMRALAQALCAGCFESSSGSWLMQKSATELAFCRSCHGW